MQVLILKPKLTTITRQPEHSSRSVLVLYLNVECLETRFGEVDWSSACVDLFIWQNLRGNNNLDFSAVLSLRVMLFNDFSNRFPVREPDSIIENSYWQFGVSRYLLRWKLLKQLRNGSCLWDLPFRLDYRLMCHSAIETRLVRIKLDLLHGDWVKIICDGWLTGDRFVLLRWACDHINTLYEKRRVGPLSRAVDTHIVTGTGPRLHNWSRWTLIRRARGHHGHLDDHWYFVLISWLKSQLLRISWMVCH